MDNLQPLVLTITHTKDKWHGSSQGGAQGGGG